MVGGTERVSLSRDLNPSFSTCSHPDFWKSGACRAASSKQPFTYPGSLGSLSMSQAELVQSPGSTCCHCLSPSPGQGMRLQEQSGQYWVTACHPLVPSAGDRNPRPW